MRFLIEPFSTIWSNRAILLGTLLVEFRSVYAGSVLGLSWVILAPLFLMVIYASVYTFIFQVRLSQTGPEGYVFLISTGLSSYAAFTASLGTGASSILINKQLLSNASFPAELLPVRAVLMAMPALIVGGIVLTALSPWLLGGSWKLLLVPVIIIAQFMMMCGIAWVLSLLTILVRDIQHILQYISTILLIVTPIGYTLEMAPSSMQKLVLLNPLAHYVLALQDLIVFDQLPPNIMLLTICLSAFVPFIGGYWIFQRTKFMFYDYA